MNEHADISGEIVVETRRREAVAAAARQASVEVGSLNGPGQSFCDITYIVGAMQEAGDRFDAAIQS